MCLSKAQNNTSLLSDCKVQLCSRGWNVISSAGPFLSQGRLRIEYSRAGSAVTLPLLPFTSPFFLYVHKRPAKLVCKLLILLSFGPFPATPIAPDGDLRGCRGLPKAVIAPGLVVPLMLSWNPLSFQPLPVLSPLSHGAVFQGFISVA